MNSINKLNKTNPSALENCALYALRKNSDAAYKAYFALGGTPAAIEGLIQRLRADKVAFVQPEPLSLEAYQQQAKPLAEGHAIEALLFDDGSQKELEAIINAYIESSRTIENALIVYQTRVLKETSQDAKKKLSERLEAIVLKKLEQSNGAATLAAVKQAGLLNEVAKRAVAKQHYALLKAIAPDLSLKTIEELCEIAIKAGNLEALQFLMTSRGSFDPELHGWLIDACKEGNEQAAAYLLEKGAKLKMQDTEKKTAFMRLLERGLTDKRFNMELIEAFINAGQEIPDRAFCLKLPRILQDALEKARERYDRLVAPTPSGATELHRAVQSGNLSQAAELLRQGHPIHARDENGDTPLHLAAKGNVELIELLLKAGASLSSWNHKGENPLNSAISANNREAIKCLLAHGADLEETNGSGHTALVQALCKNINIDSIKYLVEKCGADVKAVCAGKPLIYYAVSSYPASIIRYLLDKGADPLQKMKPDSAYRFDDLIPLLSVKEENLHLLISWGAVAGTSFSGSDAALSKKCGPYAIAVRNQLELNARYLAALEKTGTTPLHEACRRGDTTAIQAELKQGAPVNIRDKEGKTPLHLVAQTANEPGFRLLLRSGASLMAEDESGMTPVHIAARDGASYLNLMLSASPETVNLQDKRGRTPLHWAAINGGDEAINALLQNKARLDIADKEALLPYHLLTKFYPDIAKSRFNQFNTISGLDFDSWQKLCTFYLMEKMLCHRFGVNASYKKPNGETENMESFFSEITLEELAKSAEGYSHYASYAPAIRQAKALLQTASNKPSDLSQKVGQAFASSDAVAISTGWKGHATGLVLSKKEGVALKMNRGQGIASGQGGIGVYQMPGSAAVEQEAINSLRQAYSPSGMEHFQRGIDASLGLVEKGDKRLHHKDQTIGNCAWASAKLLLRGLDYINLSAKNSHQEAQRVSRDRYKGFTHRDRLAALQEFLDKTHEIQKIAIPKNVLEQNGIIHEQILQKVLFKCIRDFRVDCLTRIIDQYPLLLASVDEKGRSPLAYARESGQMQALAVIQQKLLYHRDALFFPCIRDNLSDCLKFLAASDPELVDLRNQAGKDPLTVAFETRQLQALEILKEARRRHHLLLCMDKGLRVMDCRGSPKFLNKNAVSIYRKGKGTLPDLKQLVASLKTKSSWSHLSSLENLDQIFDQVPQERDEDIIDYLLKNPMQIYDPTQYLLHASQAVVPKPVPSGDVNDKKTPLPAWYRLHDAFLESADGQTMAKILQRYRVISQPKYDNIMVTNLAMFLQRRIQLFGYNKEEMEREFRELTGLMPADLKVKLIAKSEELSLNELKVYLR